MDVLTVGQNLTGDTRQRIATKVTDPQLKSFLIALLDRTAGDTAKFESGLSARFDNGMARLSGTQRKTQMWIFAIALVMSEQ
jgi:hypothetical protein